VVGLLDRVAGLSRLFLMPPYRPRFGIAGVGAVLFDQPVFPGGGFGGPVFLPAHRAGFAVVAPVGVRRRLAGDGGVSHLASSV